jgi:hypothetical protein
MVGNALAVLLPSLSLMDPTIENRSTWADYAARLVLVTPDMHRVASFSRAPMT